MVDRIERGERYEHEKYGLVDVLDFERRIDAIDGMKIEETFHVRFEQADGDETSLTERVDDFREATSDA